MFELAPATRKLLTLFVEADYGTVFTYAAILAETECDLTGPDRSRIYTVIRRLELDHERTLMNVRGSGYKVALPSEHVASMQVRRERAGQQVALARRTGSATSVARLGSDDRVALVNIVSHLGRIEQAIGAHDARLEAIERHLGLGAGDVVDGEARDETG